MAQKFLTDIELTRGLKDSSGDLGSSGQVLSSTGTGLNWITNAATASVVYQDGFTGDGTTTAFTLANSIDNENKTQIYLDGVYQHKDTYSLSGTTLTFSTAPPNSSDIEVISFASVTADGDILTDSEFSSAGLMKTNGSGTYSIVTDNSSNWNTAYTYSQVGHLPLAGGTVSGNLIVTGDLTINGNTTTLSTQTVEVEDNILQLNTTQGSPDTATATTSGISVYRGNGVTQASFIFDDGDDTWDLTNNVTVAGNIRNTSGQILPNELSMGDNKKILVGNGDDLQIYHNGSNSIIDNNTNDLIIRCDGDDLKLLAEDDIVLRDNDDSTNFIHCVNGGGVKLYHNGNLKFETLSDGAKIHGEFYIDEKITHTGDGNTYLQFQTDRQTYVAGGVEFIDFANTTQDYITIGGSSDIDTRMQGGSGYIFIQGSNGYIGINDASPSYPFEVNGNTHIGGNISVSGTTFLDGDVTVGDTNSAFIGMARAGANYLAATNASGYLVFRTAGSNERMRIDSSGKVGIGLTNPGSFYADQLVVNEGMTLFSAGNSFLCFADGTSGDDRRRGEVRYEHSSNSMIFMTDASNRMTINGSGRVGIGTTSPQSLLHISATAPIISLTDTNSFTDANDRLIFRAGANEGLIQWYDDSANSTSTIAVFESGGNVGIGTTSPAEKLEVNGNIQSLDTVMLKNSSSGVKWQFYRDGNETLNFRYNNGSSWSANAISIKNNNNVGIGTYEPDGNLEVIASTTVSGASDSVNNVLIGLQAANRPTIILDTADTTYTNRTWNITNVGSAGSLFFGRNGLDVLVMKNDGKVGIGTTSPGATLDVSGSGAVIWVNPPAGNHSGINFRQGGTFKGWVGLNNTTGCINLGMDGSIANGINVNSSHNVGIGTTSPGAKLDVDGTIRLSTSGRIEGRAYPYTTNIGSTANATTTNITAGSSDKSEISLLGGDVGDRIEFKTNSTERMRITSTGAVLIGQTSAVSNHQLTVNGRIGGPTFSDSYLQFTGGNIIFKANDDIKLGYNQNVIVKQSGSIGIGTTSPAVNLHIASSTPKLRLQDTDGGYAEFAANNTDLVIKTDPDNAVGSSTIQFEIDGSEYMRLQQQGRLGIGTTSPTQALSVRDSGGSDTFRGIEVHNNDINNARAGICFKAYDWVQSAIWHGRGTADAYNGALVLGTNPDTTDLTVGGVTGRMWILNNGNIGIGTNNPQVKLQIVSSGTVSYAQFQTSSTGSNGANDGFTVGVNGSDAYLWQRENASLNLGTNDTSAVTINNSQNVGIGTTSPAYRLHISEAVDRSLSSSQAQMRIEGNGYSAFFALNTDSFQIGQNSNSRDLTFHSGASSADILERMRIKSHGDVVIGGTSTQNARTASFDVGTNNIVFDNCTTSGAGNGAEFQTFRRNNGTNSVQIGSIVMNGTSGITYATSSDYRLKENVVELTNALDRVDQLKPSRFNFISDGGRTIDGFLAHEVQDIVPEAIVGTKDEVDEAGNPKYQSIDQSKLVPLLVGAIKELKVEIEQLKTQINGTN